MRYALGVCGLLYLFIIASTSARAQESGIYSFGVGLSVSDFHLRDDHASPLLFSKTGLGPTVQCEYEGKTNRHYLQGAYSYADLTTDNQNFYVNNWRARISYSYLHSVIAFETLSFSSSFYCGASFSSFFCKSDYFYSLMGQFNGRAISSWYWSHSLDLIALAECRVGRQDLLHASLSVPIVSNVARPGYSPSEDYNFATNEWVIRASGETRLVSQNLSMDFLLSYRRPIISSFSLDLSYEFFFSRYDKPVEVRAYANAFRTSLFYSF